MDELIFLKSIIIILGISAFVVFLLQRIKVPSIVGFLLAGIMLGPYGLHFIDMIRENGYIALRQTGSSIKKPAFDKLDVISNIGIDLFRINSTSFAFGESLEALEFRRIISV